MGDLDPIQPTPELDQGMTGSLPGGPRQPSYPGHLDNLKQDELPIIPPPIHCQEEWQGMPEFSQEDLAPFKTIYVHFESREAIRAFSKLIGQPISIQTRSVWFPKAEIWRYANKRYVDATEETKQ